MTDHLNATSNNYPDTAVCEVVATFSDGYSSQGSGVMVSANDVLTAAHMLWSADHGGAATSVTIYAGRDGGSTPFGAEQASQWFFYEWDTLGAGEKPGHDGLLYESESQWDVGIISLATREGDQTGWFGMDPNGRSGDYHLTGYPAIYGPNRMCDDYGYVKENATYWTFDYVGIESNPGNSGGPLWYQGADGPYVVGVHSAHGVAADIYNTYDQLLA